MNTAKSLEIIYKEVLRLKGKEKAAEYVSALVFNLFHELENQGTISNENIEKHLKEEAKLCLANAKKDVA